MSSTKHQPNPRKRPHTEVGSEFPSLPSRSLAATQEFAVKSQEALLSIQKGLLGCSFPGIHCVFLPLISPHQLQQRFKVKEGSVFVVVRKSYTLLKDNVAHLIWKTTLVCTLEDLLVLERVTCCIFWLLNID